MKWLTKLLATDPESFRGKLSLLVLDKLLVGAIIALAFVAYDRYRIGDQQRFERDMATHAHVLEVERRAQEAAREERASSVQREFERARLAKDLLPLVLDKASDVVARGYVLSSALSAGLIDPDATIEVVSTLRDQGLPDSHIRRIARVALPDGLGAIARHSSRLRDEWKEGGEHPQHTVHPPDAPSLSPELKAVAREKLVWASVVTEAMPRFNESQERRVVTRAFLTRHLGSLYFLLNEGSSAVAGDLFRSSSATLRLIGALHSVINDWGPTPEAAEYIGAELASLNLSRSEDIAYARALVEVIREYAGGPRALGYGGLAPQVAVHLARILVDNSFLHRVPWIAEDAPPDQRARWLGEEPAADAHSSLQYAVGELLSQMGGRAEPAQDVLIPFIETFVQEVAAIRDPEVLGFLSARYGSYSVRFAVSALGIINSPRSNSALEKVENLGDDALAAFEGIRMELETVEQRRGR